MQKGPIKKLFFECLEPRKLTPRLSESSIFSLCPFPKEWSRGLCFEFFCSSFWVLISQKTEFLKDSGKWFDLGMDFLDHFGFPHCHPEASKNQIKSMVGFILGHDGSSDFASIYDRVLMDFDRPPDLFFAASGFFLAASMLFLQPPGFSSQPPALLCCLRAFPCSLHCFLFFQPPGFPSA